MGYYDAISALNVADGPEQVAFTKNQLVFLAKEEIQQRKDRDTLKKSDEVEGRRVPVHEYLGPLSTKQAEAAAFAEYHWDHQLLGPYVPKSKLESLSATEFAAYFDKRQFEEGRRALERVSMVPAVVLPINNGPGEVVYGDMGGRPRHQQRQYRQ